MNINLEILDAFYLCDKKEIENLNTKELVPQMVFRRRLTKASKLVIEALAKLDSKNNRILYGSSFGELLASASILKAIINKDMLSPTDFQNSVYNTAVSYASILFANKKEILTISSGDTTSLKVLKAAAIKSLDKDELVLICSETLNIPNIEDINTCIEYMEVVVALKVKFTEEKETMNINNISLVGFPKSIEQIMFIAQNFNYNNKNIVKIDI